MARSLGFAAYRALSRRQSGPSHYTSRPRPEGEVLWLHATSTNRIMTLCELGVRIRSQRHGLSVLITSQQGVVSPKPVREALAQAGVQVEQFASDHPTEARQFLDHWHPDICLWAGATLMPNLINEAAEHSIPLILIDVDQDDFSARKRKWFLDLTRSSLRQFETIMVNDQAASSLLRKTGITGIRINVTEPLRNGRSPASFRESDLSDTAQHLTGRPLWLAAYAQKDEFELILTAHRAALKLIHRLLLVVTVADPASLDRLDECLKNTSLRYTRWKIGDEIDDNTQVLISDGVNDQGLWYRMAPLTFMASSLTGEHTGRSPMEAVALGSAILFGPHVQNFRNVYSRLSAAGAGRSVGDAAGLGAAVIRLVAPDHSAAMALAGWQVVTEGAELTDRLVDLVLDRLDTKEVTDARP